MTVAVAWIRKLKSVEELIIASDSRLCGGYRWDCCPKILTLPRNDTAICFAGDTGYAYPLIMQTYFASGEVQQGRDRAIDIVKFNGFILSQLNALQGEVYYKADENDIAENEFILGGYSWIEKEFKIWRYIYNKSDKAFQKQEFDYSYQERFGKIIFAGDKKGALNKELLAIINSKYGSNYEKYKDEKFDMEPFEALVELLRKTTDTDTIGGPPQLVKIYQHMNCRPIGVYWPNMNEDNHLKNRTLLGRKLFENEKCDYSFLDPKSLRSFRIE